MRLQYFTGLWGFSLCAAGARVTSDKGYDKADRLLSSVTCSDGANGLITKYKWNSFSQIPAFPYIGGGSIVTGWNSTGCGTCFALSFQGRTIHLFVIDFVATGFNIAESAFSVLTDGQLKLGIIDATATFADHAACGVHGSTVIPDNNGGSGRGGGSGSNGGNPGTSGGSPGSSGGVPGGVTGGVGKS